MNGGKARNTVETVNHLHFAIATVLLRFIDDLSSELLYDNDNRSLLRVCFLTAIPFVPRSMINYFIYVDPRSFLSFFFTRFFRFFFYYSILKIFFIDPIDNILINTVSGRKITK